MGNQNFIAKKAFSLIELSIVILIIGILIAGVTQSSRLINAMRLTTAQTMTQSAPVASIPNLLYWLETTSEASFISTEAQDGTVVTQWNDINPQSTVKYNAYAGQKTNSSLATYNPASGGTSGNTGGPTYIANGFNGLPVLRFTNNTTSAYRYMVVDPNVRNNPNASITVFVVFFYRSGSGYIFDRVCLDANNVTISCTSAVYGSNPLFGAQVNSLFKILFERRDDGGTVISNYFLDTTVTLSGSTKYLLTLERKYGASYSSYVNGNLTATNNSDPLGALHMQPMKIGRHATNDTDTMDIDIAEIIVFSGNIKNDDREAVENYLGKKWGLKVN